MFSQTEVGSCNFRLRVCGIIYFFFGSGIICLDEKQYILLYYFLFFSWLRTIVECIQIEVRYPVWGSKIEMHFVVSTHCAPMEVMFIYMTSLMICDYSKSKFVVHKREDNEPIKNQQCDVLQLDQLN